MRVKIKKLHEEAKMPKKGTASAAGFDLYASKPAVLSSHEPKLVATGLAFEIPDGYVGVVYSRSSTAQQGVVITPLLVDADYRGEVFILASNQNDWPVEVRTGDRIAQMRIEKLIDTEYVWADELSETVRGSGGYGSTGR